MVQNEESEDRSGEQDGCEAHQDHGVTGHQDTAGGTGGVAQSAKQKAKAGKIQMLTILASYAQEESLSASENQKWRIRRNFENGMPWNGTMLGYRYDKGALVIVPEEAKTVKRIFDEYLSGLGLTTIATHLTCMKRI